MVYMTGKVKTRQLPSSDSRAELCREMNWKSERIYILLVGISIITSRYVFLMLLTCCQKRYCCWYEINVVTNKCFSSLFPLPLGLPHGGTTQELCMPYEVGEDAVNLGAEMKIIMSVNYINEIKQHVSCCTFGTLKAPSVETGIEPARLTSRTSLWVQSGIGCVRMRFQLLSVANLMCWR